MRQGRRTSEAEKLARDASLLEGEGLIADALRKYLKAAKLGDCIAQSNLGNLLDDKLRPPRPREAVYWYKRAIRAGHPTAAYNLAMHYRNLGNRRWCAHWLRVAQGLGDPDATAELKKLMASTNTGSPLDRIGTRDR